MQVLKWYECNRAPAITFIKLFFYMDIEGKSQYSRGRMSQSHHSLASTHHLPCRFIISVKVYFV